jgi:GT2 family glycosyltransferase
MTLKCLDSVLSNIKINKNDFYYKIIMINNGSDKYQMEAVKKKINDYKSDGSLSINISIDILSINPNRGFSAGMNCGLEFHFNDNADYVTCISNDVELDRDFFPALSKIVNDKNDGDLIYCPHVYYLMDKTKLSYTHGILDIRNDELILSHKLDLSKNEIIFPEYYPAAAVIWSKKAYIKLKGFNENFYCYWEDVDLSYRCSINGTHLILKPELKIHHLGRGTTSGKEKYNIHYLNGKELMKNILYS